MLVFDIETIPDLAGLRATGLAQGDTDAQAFAAWQAQRAEQGKTDFAPLHLQRVLVIRCVFRNAEGLRLHSFVDRETEGQLVLIKSRDFAEGTKAFQQRRPAAFTDI